MNHCVSPPPDRIQPPRRKRLEWATWRTKDFCPMGFVSFYLDLNVEGVYLGGSLWRFEGYLNLTLRRAVSR